MKLFLKYQNCDTLDDTFFKKYIYIEALIYWIDQDQLFLTCEIFDLGHELVTTS